MRRDRGAGGQRRDHLRGEVGDGGGAGVGLRRRGARQRRVAAADEHDLAGRAAGDDRRRQGLRRVQRGERGGGGEQLRRGRGDGRGVAVEVEQHLAGRDVDDLGGDAGAQAGGLQQRPDERRRGRRGRARGPPSRARRAPGWRPEVGQLRVRDGHRLRRRPSSSPPPSPPARAMPPPTSTRTSAMTPSAMRRRKRPVLAVTIVEPLDAMVPTPQKGDLRRTRGATVGHTTPRAVRRDGRNPEGPAEQVRAGPCHRTHPLGPDAVHLHPLPGGLRLHREHPGAGRRPARCPGAARGADVPRVPDHRAGPSACSA